MSRLRAIGAGSGITNLSPNSNYYFHGFAGQQINGDPRFYDRSGALNHGEFGANLSNLQAWSNDFYVSTVDPAGGATDSVIRLPSLNLDYTAGEKLIFWWLGQGTAEGSDVECIGDGNSATYHGLSLRCKATSGKIQLMLRDGTGAFFGSTSTNNVMGGTLNSFGFVLDGQARKFAYWYNDILETSFSDYSTFSSGSAVDTRNSNTFNIGQAQPAVAASTAGLALMTRALVMLRLSATATVPSVSTVTNIFKALRANPGKLIRGSAF